MKSIIKYVCIASAMVLSFAACDKWTETEAVSVVYPTIKDKYPALYEQYLQGLRTYRGTDHHVMIAKFDNKSGVLQGRADHLNCLPDSIDYVILNNAADISSQISEEIEEIRLEKGMKTLMNVSYPALEAEYLAMIAEEEQAQDTVVNTQERFVGWMAENVAKTVALCDANKLDGINVIFTGINPNSMTEDELALEEERQKSFFAAVNSWINKHPDAVLFFEGVPRNVIYETTVVESAKYIIAQAESVNNTHGLSYAVEQLIAEGVPTDRFVIGVTAIDITDPTNLNGYFGDSNAILGAALWATDAADYYNKAGVCVNHAQFDYYNVGNVYQNIRKAISTMNPSPVK